MRQVLFVLGELNDSDADWLLAVGARRTLAPGAVLIQERKPVDALYFVLDGQLSVSVADPDPREVARIGCGEIVGEMSFLDSRPPAATVTVIEQALVLAIPRTGLASKLKADLGFGARFYRALGILLARRLRDRTAYENGGLLSDEASYDDELDPETLESVARAGARFDHILKRTSGA
jgi:bacteriocin-type transport-associated protein